MPKPQAKLTDNELQRLVQLIRVTQWQYKLDTYGDEALKEILKSTRKVRQEINQRLKQIKPISQFTKERLESLADEMQHLTAATQAQITGQITQVATDAGVASYKKHNDILSFGGRVPNFNPITLSATQLRSMVTETPIGGHLLNEWVTRVFDASLQDTIKTEIMTGMMQGESYRSLVKRFDDVAFPKLTRNVETLVRSYVQSVNVQASKDVANANKDLVKGWKWSSVCENRTCVACLSNDSKDIVYPLNEGPEIPLHPRCFTGDSQVYAPDAIAAMRFKYDGIVYDFESPSGDLFSVTPNHPFLTVDGFISAHEINNSIDIIYDRRLDGIFVDKDVQDMPTTFEQIFSSFYILGSSGCSTSITASDFHGDAIFGNGNIDIVYADGLLSDNSNSGIYKNIGKRLLSYANMCDLNFTSLCESFSMFFSMGFATQAVTGGLSMCEAFGIGHAGESVRSSFNIASDTYTSPFKSAPDSSFAGIKSLTDLVSRKTALIEIADNLNIQVGAVVYDIAIVDKFIRYFGSSSFYDALTDDSIRNKFAAKGKHLANFLFHKTGTVKTGNLKFLGKRHFSGHVYDLQCFSTIYHVGGMLSSNCRCFPEMVTKTFRELGMDVGEIKQAYKPYTVRGNIDSVTGKITAGKVSTGGGRIISTDRFLGNYEDYFKIQSKAVQFQTLGPGRYELWQSGKIKLSDLTDKNGKLRLLKELQ